MIGLVVCLYFSEKIELENNYFLFILRRKYKITYDTNKSSKRERKDVINVPNKYGITLSNNLFLIFFKKTKKYFYISYLNNLTTFDYDKKYFYNYVKI